MKNLRIRHNKAIEDKLAEAEVKLTEQEAVARGKEARMREVVDMVQKQKNDFAAELEQYKGYVDETTNATYYQITTIMDTIRLVTKAEKDQELEALRQMLIGLVENSPLSKGSVVPLADMEEYGIPLSTFGDKMYLMPSEHLQGAATKKAISDQVASLEISKDNLSTALVIQPLASLPPASDAPDSAPLSPANTGQTNPDTAS